MKFITLDLDQKLLYDRRVPHKNQFRKLKNGSSSTTEVCLLFSVLVSLLTTQACSASVPNVGTGSAALIHMGPLKHTCAPVKTHSPVGLGKGTVLASPPKSEFRLISYFLSSFCVCIYKTAALVQHAVIHLSFDNFCVRMCWHI